MTRDEFIEKHQPSMGVSPEPHSLAYERQEFVCDIHALLAATRAEALRLAMAECEAEAALCDSEKSGLDAGSAARNCRDRIADLVRR